MPKRITDGPELAVRFWSKVDRTGECWEWTGYRDPNGYGRFSVGGRGGSVQLAHRYAWEMQNGSANGLFVCHHCDNPPCVNPAHMFLGTQVDNMRDMASKGRWSPRNTACGERQGLAKLTEESVRAIRSRAVSETIAALAREFCVSESTIACAVHRRTWRHVV